MRWVYWPSSLALALTVESWSSTVPVAFAILAYVAVMTWIAVRWS